MRTILLLVAAFAASRLNADESKVAFKIHGQGWVDAGRIMHSSDTLLNDGTPNTINLNGNFLSSVGAQFTMVADFSENMEGAFGFGAYKATHSQGTYGDVNGNPVGRQPLYFAISLFKNYLTEARLTYFQGEKNAPWLSLTVGSFAYNYNKDSKDLGLYLLRGPVYPALLFGGFRDFSADTTKSNTLGIKVHHAMGNFTHDLILKNEQDLPPTLDWSLAYVAKYKALEAIEFGGGVNFYRVAPYNKKLETPGHLQVDGGRSIEVNPLTNDTTFYTFQGTKVMGMFSLDINHFLQIGALGPNDLKLYGEAALLGTKNYGTIYKKMSERVPVMVGFNLPAFGLLDYLSLEVEYYGSKYRNDLANIGNLNAVADWTTEQRPTPSPVPVKEAYKDSTADNVKWAVNLEKTVHSHVRFTAQVANDHYRPRPISTALINAAGGTSEAFTNPKDWYFMFRMGYFF